MSPTLIIVKQAFIRQPKSLNLPPMMLPCPTSDEEAAAAAKEAPGFAVKPLNLEGGQCIWCGKYGHRECACPLLK